MIIGNKKAVGALPLPCTLLLVQVIGTLVLLGVLPYSRRAMAGVSTRVVVAWIPIAVIFSTMIFTSLKSFQHAGVATILIFRNATAILTTATEVVMGQASTSAGVLAAELTIVIGATMYGNGAIDFSWVGFGWIFFNMCAQVAYGVTLKSYFAGNAAMKGLSKFDMSLLNNALCVPLVAAVGLAQGETVDGAVAAVRSMDATGALYVGLTCVAGFLISTSGFGLQRLVSASTFIVVNNLAKFVNILLGIVFLGEQVRGPMAIGGCVVAVLGGCWYSFETTRIAQNKAKKA
eukprot:CAMPEP_0174855136 /NCGR_PEP_ID=MMETSP1114-20130205/32544_1 /TAXON_ID=312471 /ORGANISM="Neobodo designis, Strain CCAP 1951/1" /LENGTH=289 /DNA_ID=CAMNT_0016089861 /DNA_START=94 /DNA_END=963 /DNA_ORIENTATION=+